MIHSYLSWIWGIRVKIINTYSPNTYSSHIVISSRITKFQNTYRTFNIIFILFYLVYSILSSRSSFLESFSQLYFSFDPFTFAQSILRWQVSTSITVATFLSFEYYKTPLEIFIRNQAMNKIVEINNLIEDLTRRDKKKNDFESERITR